MPYCSDQHEDGWLCILAKAHKGKHLSLDNRRVWQGSPGWPIFWGEDDDLPREITEEDLDPTLVHSEINKAKKATTSKPTQQSGGLGALTGDGCSICGQFAVVRESACRTRCRACGTIDGGCG